LESEIRKKDHTYYQRGKSYDDILVKKFFITVTVILKTE